MTAHSDGRDADGPLRVFLATLARDNPPRLLWVTVVQVLSALGQGAGLVLLVPLLETVGVGTARAGGVAGEVRRLLHTVGLRPTLTSLLVVYVVVVTVTAALTGYQNVELIRYRLTFVDSLRSRLYEAAASAEWGHHLGRRQSDLLNVLTLNVNTVAQGTQAILAITSSVLVMAIQVAVALTISPAMTLVAAFTAVALVCAVWPLVARSRRLGRSLADSNRELMGAVTGFFDGLKLTKAHGLEAGHVSTFKVAMRAARQAQVGFARASAVASAVQMTVTALALAVVVDISLTRLHVPVADLLVLALIFTRIAPQMISAQQNVQQAALALPAMEELVSLITDYDQHAEPPAPTGTSELLTDPLTAGVRLDSVSYSYRSRALRPGDDGGSKDDGGATGDRTGSAGGGDSLISAVREVSFEVAAHKTTALVGPSGAGKTTLGDLVAGLVEPASGSVLVDGVLLTGATRRAWRSRVGLAPQEPFLFHDTIRANLAWSAPQSGEREMWAALDAASAAALVRGLPNGLDTLVGDRGIRLSGGERQRVALARALLRRPDLLVLDEATSFLDTENELAIRRSLSRLHGQMTILVIAHRLSTVSHADVVVVVDRGRVVERGTWSELSGVEGGRLSQLIEAGALT